MNKFGIEFQNGNEWGLGPWWEAGFRLCPVSESNRDVTPTIGRRTRLRSEGTGRRHLRGDFEGGAEVVFAEGLCGAEQVALAVDNHTQRVLAVGGSKFMDHAVRPLAASLRRQLEDHSA